MAPNHLSVREMREDEKPLVLEMLKVRARGVPCAWLQPLARASPDSWDPFFSFWLGPFPFRFRRGFRGA